MGTGSKGKEGGHHVAFMQQADFLATDTLTLLTATNRWRYGTDGWFFRDQVLSKNPATVGAAIELAKANKGRTWSATEAMKHLRWLYTWTGELAVNGKRWEETQSTAAPRAKRSKAKAKAKASA